MNTKNMHILRIIVLVILLLSAILRFIVDNESLKTGLTDVAGLMLGINETIAYIKTKEKIELYFSIMFYVFCVGAVIFAVVGLLFHPV